METKQSTSYNLESNSTDLGSDLGASFIDEDGAYVTEPEEFIPLTWNLMPTQSLQDAMRNLETKAISILNLDAMLQSDARPEVYMYVWQSILMRINLRTDIKMTTLSIRFNKMDTNMKDIFIIWLEMNETLETVYLMGSGFDSPAYIKKLQAAWKKHLYLHRYENNFMTLYRSIHKVPQENT